MVLNAFYKISAGYLFPNYLLTLTLAPPDRYLMSTPLNQGVDISSAVKTRFRVTGQSMTKFPSLRFGSGPSSITSFHATSSVCRTAVGITANPTATEVSK